MKLGLEDRKKVYAVVALALLAAFLFYRIFDSGQVSAASPPARTVPGESPRFPAPAAAPRAPRPAANLDPTLRTNALKNVENQVYKGSGRNIFEYAEVRIPQPKQPVVTPPTPSCEPNCPPLPTPPPPPINLKFIGFANHAGQPLSVFLQDGEDIFIGREGEIINRRYKIGRIGKTSVDIEDVPNNNKQTIPLTPG